MQQVHRQDVIDSKGQLVLIHAINPFGFFALRRVAEGQYDYPKGIFFGGHKTARCTAIIETNILRWARGRHVVHLDLHSGLGKHGKYKLLVPGKRSQTDLAYYSKFLGPEIEHLGSDRGIAYKTKGDFGQYVLSISETTDYHFFFAEFGTYSGICVLKALRTENQAFFFSPQLSVR
jgi:hypothetical protein